MVEATSIMGGSPCPCCDDAKPFIGEARSNPGLFHVHPLSGMNMKEFQQEEVMMKDAIEYETTHLRNRDWAVRPLGHLGTMGWTPVPWTVVYVRADSPRSALVLAASVRAKTGQA